MADAEFDVVYRRPPDRQRRTVRVKALDSQQARRRAREMIGNDVSIVRVSRVLS